MKFSYNWLAELVVGLDAGPHKVAAEITMKTAEGEGVEVVGSHLTEVSLAKVESVEPIGETGAVKAEVVTQRYGRKTVVCGAPNCRAGVLTVYIPPGTVLNGAEIGLRKVYGIDSEGMLCSGSELELNRETEGILEMGKGSNLGLLACLPDHIIEIDNKSLNHRPDLWGHLGMAREVAAWSELALRDPVEMKYLPIGSSPLTVRIEEPELCPRYSGLVIENVTIQPSPLWMQYRLRSIGLNPINNIVDVTNYVMAELAQPMHAFDRKKIHEDTILVRRAEAGETIAALNDESYDLSPDVLVIADPRGPVAIAGIIGGAGAAITSETTSIILESANFQAANIRKSSTRLKLRTDASMRFEKAQDPANTVRALARAAQLIEQISPGARLVGGIGDVYFEKPAPAPIEVDLDWMGRKLGRRVEAEEVRGILRRLQFGVTELAERVLRIEAPSWRATKDISLKEDLVEEIGRMVGYGSIPPAPPSVAVTVPHVNETRRYFRRIRALLTSHGYTEVYNYSFLSDEQVEAFRLNPHDLLALDNPIAAGQNFMRSTLLPGLRKNVLDNSRHFEAARIFEIGYEIHARPSGLPNEVPHLAVAVYQKGGTEVGLFELKRIAEALAPGLEVRPSEPLPYEHPARAAQLLWQGEPIGRLFEFHPEMAPQRTAVLDLDLAVLERLTPAHRTFRPIPRFPASAFDLSVIAGERELVSDLKSKLFHYASDRLTSMEFVRQYAGPPIPEGKKSVSFRLTVASPDRTLSLEEVGEIRNRIIAGLKTEGYELRV